MKRLKCIEPKGNLERNKIYTLKEKTVEHGKIYISVNEIDNGNNSYFDWRFVEIPYEISKNIQVL